MRNTRSPSGFSNASVRGRWPRRVQSLRVKQAPKQHPAPKIFLVDRLSALILLCSWFAFRAGVTPASGRSGRTAQDSFRALRRRALQVLPTARKHEKQTAHKQTNRGESQSARLRGGYRTCCDVQSNVIEIYLVSVSSEFDAEESPGDSGTRCASEGYVCKCACGDRTV